MPGFITCPDVSALHTVINGRPSADTVPRLAHQSKPRVRRRVSVSSLFRFILFCCSRSFPLVTKVLKKERKEQKVLAKAVVCPTPRLSGESTFFIPLLRRSISRGNYGESRATLYHAPSL